MRGGCFEEFSMKLLPECRMRSRSSTPRGCSRPCVKTILTLEKLRSSSTTSGKRGMSTFTAGSFSVVIAEIELKQESQELILPRWIGREVTGDSFYRKSICAPVYCCQPFFTGRASHAAGMLQRDGTTTTGLVYRLKGNPSQSHALLRDQNRLTGNE